MKKFFVGCVLAAMVAMTVVAVSCSKDDDDDDAACWNISYTYKGQHYSDYVWDTKSEIDKGVKEAKADGVTDIHYEKTNHSKEECERQN